MKMMTTTTTTKTLALTANNKKISLNLMTTTNPVTTTMTSIDDEILVDPNFLTMERRIESSRRFSKIPTFIGSGRK